MKVKRIQIDFDMGADETPHAEYAVFENGTWNADGPLYSRILPVLHEIWKLARGIVSTSEGGAS